MRDLFFVGYLLALLFLAFNALSVHPGLRLSGHRRATNG